MILDAGANPARSTKSVMTLDTVVHIRFLNIRIIGSLSPLLMGLF